MGLRGQILAVLATLLALALLGLAWVAGGLLHQSAERAVQFSAAPGGDLVHLRETLVAAETVVYLAAAALLAVTVAVAAVLLRGPILGPLERLGRHLERTEPVPGLAPDAPLVERIGRTLGHQRQLLERQQIAHAGHLDVVQAYGVAMDRARAQLVAADRLAMTGQLALGAAHELGGQLAIAMACMDTLHALSAAQPGDPARVSAHTHQASEALERLAAITAELGAFGRPFEGGGPAADPAVSAREVAALSRLHKRCRTARVWVTVAPEAEGLALAIGRRHLEQVLLNLVVNAADATEGRGQIEIAVHPAAGGAQIAVQDDGPGVPESLQERVFEPFFSTKAPEAGSGLGLAVSRRLVEDAGGRLRLATAQGVGARFVLHLPALRATQGAERGRVSTGPRRP